MGKTLAEPAINPQTGEIIANADDEITMDIAVALENAGVDCVMIKTAENPVKVFTNKTVPLDAFVDFDCSDYPSKWVYNPAL